MILNLFSVESKHFSRPELLKNNFYLKILSLIDNIKRAMPGLFGFVGIDILIRNDMIYIVEINPRLTTSYVGLYETIGCNMVDLLLNHK